MHSLREGRRGGLAPRQLSGRGLAYWTDGQGDNRVLYVTPGYRLIALDAATGDPIPTFGDGGIVDLKVGVVYGRDQPIDLETGEMLPARWRAWLGHDPINMVESCTHNLESLKAIYIDCGWKDNYHIHYGTRILSKRLTLAGIKHVYEEFPDTHSRIDYRMDRSLPFLYRALKPAQEPAP